MQSNETLSSPLIAERESCGAARMAKKLFWLFLSFRSHFELFSIVIVQCTLVVVDEKEKSAMNIVCHERQPSSEWIIVCWHPTYDAIIQPTIKSNAHFITCIKSNPCGTHCNRRTGERHKTIARVWLEHQQQQQQRSILFISISLPCISVQSQCARCCCRAACERRRRRQWKNVPPL